MSFSEALNFVAPNRLHVKEGIFNPNEDDPFSSYNFAIPFSTIGVLAGMDLSEQQQLKIDKTVLADVVCEEENAAERYKILRGTSTEDDEDGDLKKNKKKQKNKKKDDDDDLDDLLKDLDVDDKDSQEEDDKGTDKDKEKIDIYEMLRLEALSEKEQHNALMASRGGDDDDDDDDTGKMTPFTGNEQYLADHIEWLALRLRVIHMAREREDDLDKDPKQELQLRELKAKERMLKARCEKRLALTMESSSGWMPRLERLALRLNLEPFERLVLLTLVLNVISNKISPENSRFRSKSVDNFTVGALIGLYCDSFEEELRYRSYFYKSARLVKEGIIRLSDSWERELMNTSVELDRRMLDFVVGLDTELSELVEGSHLYTPTVKLENVIMPEDQKNLIVNTVKNFDKFTRSAKKLNLGDTISYGSGMLLLFFGKSGTGKTMMANALAAMLGKRILLINYPSLGSSDADLVIKFIFRESKLTDSILFFDECESIFMSRDTHHARGLNLLLTEIERHNGLIIMATNRAFDLDEAMHRRITLAIEFRQPDPHLRAQIWKSLMPVAAKLTDDVDFHRLALKYELTGGFIKNAILVAMSEAINRDSENLVISQKDLELGALNQLRGRLAMVDFERRIVPSRGIENITASPEIIQKLERIIQMEKARQILFSEWGYSEKMFNDQGTTCLFYGPPGTGKTLAAEVIGFETGKPLKMVNSSQLVNKYVGQTGKHIESLFEEAKSLDAIIVFDDAEALFGMRGEQISSTDRYANLDTSILLHHIERFPGIAILTTNLIGNIDEAFFRRFRFTVEFKLPTAAQREVLWKTHLPPRAPLAPSVDFKELANKYQFSGGVIKNCCFKAAATAALRIDPEKRKITMIDLVSVAEEELSLKSGAPSGLFT